MSKRQTYGITRKSAEQLLDGTPGSGPADLMHVLSAAKAAGREGELAGEYAVVAAFEANHLSPVAATPRRKKMALPLAKFLSVKVIAWSLASVVTAGAAAGGAAVALSGNNVASVTPSSNSLNANAAGVNVNAGGSAKSGANVSVKSGSSTTASRAVHHPC